MDSPDKQEKNRNEDGTFKPGKSGNPKGRPKKGLAIADILNDLGDQEIRGNDSWLTQKEAVLARVYDQAMSGDLNATKFIADRTEGTSVQRMAVTSNEPIQVMRIVEPKE